MDKDNYHIIYYENNKKTILEQKKEYYIKNKEIINQKRKILRKNNAKLKTQRKEYYIKNKDNINKNRKIIYKKNKNIIIEKQKEYYEENKDNINEKRKISYKNNKDKISKKQKEYYKENKDKIIKKNKKYRDNNKELIKKKANEYYQKNKKNILIKRKIYSLCTSCKLFQVRINPRLCSYCNPNKSKKQKTKEIRLKTFLEKENYKIIHNKKCNLDNSCQTYYPDFLIDNNTFFIIIECDENAHSSYDKSCEKIRENNICYALGLPCVFIRYNPDLKGVKIKTKEIVLKSYINYYMNKKKTNNEVCYLFYNF